MTASDDNSLGSAMALIEHTHGQLLKLSCPLELFIALAPHLNRLAPHLTSVKLSLKHTTFVSSDDNPFRSFTVVDGVNTVEEHEFVVGRLNALSDVMHQLPRSVVRVKILANWRGDVHVYDSSAVIPRHVHIVNGFDARNHCLYTPTT